MQFLEFLGNYLLSGSGDSNLIAVFLCVVVLCFPALFIIENYINKKAKAKKERAELEKICGKMS